MATSIAIASKRPTERRLSPARYKLLLTAHMMVSVGWLGAVFAKLVLGLAAMTSAAPAVAAALYAATGVVNVAYPPLAIGTVVSGVLLSLGTKWGLLQHYWVATKLVLTVGVIATAVQLAERLPRQAIAAAGPVADIGMSLSRPAADAGTSLGLAAAPTLLLALSVAHLLMLGVATVLSVYKPWGKTPWARRPT